jgi:catechol 2,3-dioxygenase-like lactoylglutathione lyase family enzyme
MITRFDHAVIAVCDLDRAVEAYGALGFEVFPGGRHEHRGTHNALIRFGGADYVELLGVYDPDKAVHSGLNGRTLAEFVRDREGGLVGHCYATDDIEAEAARMREAGLEMVGPFEMRRERPEGRTLTWRLLVPEDIPWRRRWPFFIQWDDPVEERLSVEGVGAHPNGARAVTGVAVAVRDLEEAVSLYSTLFDAEPRRRGESTGLAAEHATFDIRGFTIDLLAPRGDGPVRRALERDGEGPLEVTVEVADPEVAVEVLARAGIEPERAREGTLRVPASAASGAQLVLTGSSDRQAT